MSDLGVIEDGAVAMSDGVITHVGPTEEVLRNIHAEDYLEIRAENQAVLPGFVDSHTHFIFGGYREEEFSWRLRGDSYMSIMERGGGIVNTMKATRESDFDTLWDRGEERLDELFSMGVTTVEGKSGYGLDLQTELVQLRVMSDLNESHPMDVVSTFFGELMLFLLNLPVVRTIMWISLSVKSCPPSSITGWRNFAMSFASKACSPSSSPAAC